MIDDLEEESFSSIKDACLHRAVMADEKLKYAKSSGCVYAAFVILLYLVVATEFSWHILIFLWGLYLPIRDIHRASKKKDKAYEEYAEICAKTDGGQTRY